MHLKHESFAVVIHEGRAFTAHCFANERLLPLRVRPKPHDGGMELHKLKISYFRAGAHGRRNSIAGSNARVCCLRKDLTNSTGSKNYCRGVHGTDSVTITFTHDMQGHTLNGAAIVSEQIKYQCVLDELNAVVKGHCGNECARDFKTGGITTGMRDSRP